MANNQLANRPEQEPEEVTRYKLIKRVQRDNNYPRLEVLVKLVKKENDDITKTQVEEFLKKDVATQVTKEQKPKHTEGHLVSYAPNDMWLFDIFDLSRYEKKNNGFKYLLACVDGFTRKAYVEPMEEKTSPGCAKALETILDRSGVKPKAMFSDNDKAFTSDPFQDFAKKRNIFLKQNAHEDHRALGIIDNFAKRIKQTLTRRFGDEGSVRWIKIIREVVDNYNKMETKALDGIAPDKATGEKEKDAILTQNLEKNQFNTAVADIKAGDRVRKATHKAGGTTKGTDPIWSDKVFTVEKVQSNTVTLTDSSIYKRTDLLIVPPGDYEHGAHPVNVQLKENKKKHNKRTLRKISFTSKSMDHGNQKKQKNNHHASELNLSLPHY